MTRISTAIWHAAAVILIVLCAVPSWADVTVIGTAGLADRPAADSDKPPERSSPGVADVSPDVAGASPTASENPAVTPAPVFSIPSFTLASRPLETTWYARFDYYNWSERGVYDANEHGAMYTMGLQRTVGAHRVRFELFEGCLDFNGESPSQLIDMNSRSKNLGFRTECDFLWDVNRDVWHETDVFAGIGTRFWIRDIQDGINQSSGEYIEGANETWWTLYFHIGLEKKWRIETGGDIFLSGRVGCTPFTYEYTQVPGQPSLFPTLGVTGEIEAGFRYEGFLCLVYFDAMGWGKSAIVDDFFQQPAAQMFSTGLKIGFSY
jgi:hypothetical protein